MAYNLKDAQEAMVGAFSAVLLFYALRVEPITLVPTVGLLITILWVGIFYKTNGLPKGHFVPNLIVTFVISGLMSLVFGLATQEQLLSFQYFSTSAIVGVWLGFPIALLLDKHNTINLVKRHFIAK